MLKHKWRSKFDASLLFYKQKIPYLAWKRIAVIVAHMIWSSCKTVWISYKFYASRHVYNHDQKADWKVDQVLFIVLDLKYGCSKDIADFRKFRNLVLELDMKECFIHRVLQFIRRWNCGRAGTPFMWGTQSALRCLVNRLFISLKNVNVIKSKKKKRQINETILAEGNPW